jgi:hypothetical protein
MCNLYSLTRGQAAIRDLFSAKHDRTGNLPLFPDQLAPIARNGPGGGRELVMARWGMPGPPQFGGAPITNIRNVRARTGDAGWGNRAAALFRRPRFANTRTPSPGRRPSGSRLMQTGRCSPSPACGRPGLARAGQRARRSRASTSFSASSRRGQRRGRANSPQGNASHSDDAGRGRPLACGRCAQGTRIAAAVARRSRKQGFAHIERKGVVVQIAL